ncbi:hypothetical protein ACTD5D_39760 [Nocardia takedensis]|uniref:hypothetical protein n=1 Tax=Nocardia takedensis TaxID=259390 RepID=UPI003F771B99
MIYVRIRELPASSALARDANGGTAPWSMTDHLIADLWRLHLRHYLGKKAPKALDHPGRPKPPPPVMSPRAAARRAARLRQSQRRRAQIRARRKES